MISFVLYQEPVQDISREGAMVVSSLPPPDQLASVLRVIVLGGPNTGWGEHEPSCCQVAVWYYLVVALIDNRIIRFFWLLEPISGHCLVSVKVSESFLTISDIM